MASVLISKYNRLDAIITSIQNGEDEDEIFHQLDNGEAYCVDTTDRIEQANGLFSSALTLYQFLYNNPEIEEEYGDTTDREKLIRVLAVAERKAQRKIIATYRDEFGKYLSSPHYKQHFVDFLEGGVQELFEGKDILPTHLATLAVQPHDKDRHLDLKVDYEGGDDPWAWFFGEVTAAGSAFDEVLSKELDLDTVQQSILSAKAKFKLSRRFIKCFNTTLKALAKYVVRQKEVTVLLNYLVAHNVKGEPVFFARPSELSKAASPGWKVDINQMAKNHRLIAYENGRYTSSTDRIRIRSGRTAEQTRKMAASHRIRVPIRADSNNLEKWIKDMIEHSRFKAFLVGLELVNAAVNFRKYAHEDSSKNILSGVGSLAHLMSASSAYAEVKMSQGVIQSGRRLIGVTRGFTRVVGFVGSGISVTMCVWDSIESFQARDYDASFAWGLTGVVSGILLANGVLASSAASGTAAAGGFLGFWPTIVLSALFFGGTFLAIYLADTPLEKFLKNNVFNKQSGPLRYSPNTPFWYIHAIDDQKHLLVPGKFKDWRNFQRAAEDLYDLLMSYRVSDKILNYHQIDDPEKKSSRIKKATSSYFGANVRVAKTVQISVQLRKFFDNISKFDFAVKMFTKGVANPSPEDSILDARVAILETDAYGADILQITYDIPIQYQNTCTLSSELIFISRTIVNDELNEYWPHQNKQERYLGYRIKLTNWQEPTYAHAKGEGGLIHSYDDVIENSITNILLENHMRVGTMIELFNPSIWHK